MRLSEPICLQNCSSRPLPKRLGGATPTRRTGGFDRPVLSECHTPPTPRSASVTVHSQSDWLPSLQQVLVTCLQAQTVDDARFVDGAASERFRLVARLVLEPCREPCRFI